MKIEGNKITADAGKLLTKGGIYSDCIFLGKNDSVDNWKEVNSSDYPDYVYIGVNYDDLVESKIRLRYTISAEFAVLRQRIEKPAEYQQYYDYCELCKSAAKTELGLV